MFPIPVNRNHSIAVSSDYTYGTHPLPLLNIPDDTPTQQAEIVMPDMSVKQVTQFLFYCDSEKKSNIENAETLRNPGIDTRGCGSAENPWKDINFALSQVQCFANMVCDREFAFRIILTGIVNYAVGFSGMHHRGYGIVSVDCTEAVFDIEIKNEITDYTYFFRYLCGISFENIGDFSFKWEAGGVCNFTLISDCSSCAFIFKSISTAMKYLPGHYCEPSSLMVNACVNCRITCEKVDMSAEYVPFNSSTYHVFAYGNSFCQFTVANIEIKVVYAEKSASKEFIECFGFQDNYSCTFVDCTANTLVISNLTDRPDSDFQAYGCGWHGNTENEWIGSNIGYCRYYDSETQSYIFTANCTLNDNCTLPDDPAEPSSSVEPSSESSSSGDTSKGHVKETGYRRILDFKTTPNFSDYHGDEACKADYYYSRILVHDKYPYAFSTWHGKMATVQGEVFEEEDENGDPVYYCELPSGPYYNEETDKIEIYDPEKEETSEIKLDIKGLIAEIDTTLQGVIQGTIHHNTVSPDAVADFPSDGWTGYRWYRPYHENSWTSTLEKSGQALVYETESYPGYYSAWGGIPCGTSAEPVTGSITVNTSVFEWIPNDDYDGPAPKKLILIDEKGKRRKLDFGVEYCPTELDYVEHDWFRVVSCGSGNNEWAVPAGVVTDTGWEKKQKITRTTYTYDGVLF